MDFPAARLGSIGGKSAGARLSKNKATKCCISMLSPGLKIELQKARVRGPGLQFSPGAGN